MIVVSNTSPLIYLSKIKKLDLLLQLYKKVHIPPKVLEELLKEKDEVAYFKAFASSFIVEKADEKMPDFQLHGGETEAINLALNKKADIILLDDHKARNAAKALGLNVKGTLGLLLTFLEKKLIGKNEFKALVDDLIKADFRISIELYNEVLKKAENFNSNL